MLRMFYSGTLSSFLLLFIPLLFAVPVLAEVSVSGGRADGPCGVMVRVIKASDRSPEFSSRSLQMGKFLQDVGPQLEPLPFKNYRAIDKYEGRVNFKKTSSFQIRAAHNQSHRVNITPHSFYNNKIDVTVDWKGPKGEEIVSTKQQLVNGMNLVLGTDSSKDSSTIVCVRIDCK